RREDAPKKAEAHIAQQTAWRGARKPRLGLRPKGLSRRSGNSNSASAALSFLRRPLRWATSVGLSGLSLRAAGAGSGGGGAPLRPRPRASGLPRKPPSPCRARCTQYCTLICCPPIIPVGGKI